MGDFLRKHQGRPRHIYYCGHGYSDGGWAIYLHGKDAKDAKRTITRQDMEGWLAQAPGFLEVIVQACHSGNWCYTKEFQVVASAQPFETSRCSPQGSFVTRYLYGEDIGTVNYWKLKSQPVSNREDITRVFYL